MPIRCPTHCWTGGALLDVESAGGERGVKLMCHDIEDPSFQPRSYVDLRVEILLGQGVRIELGDCPALQEETTLTWFSQLGEEPHPAITALAQQVNPRARVVAADPKGARLAWTVEIDETAEPTADPQELGLARLSGGMRFQFEQWRLLRDWFFGATTSASISRRTTEKRPSSVAACI